jgi:hypothetical protein
MGSISREARLAYLEHALREVFGKAQAAMRPAGLVDCSRAVYDIRELVEKALQPDYEPAVVKALRG